MIIQFVLVLSVLLGFCALVLDVGLFELKKIQLQNAADAAALGARVSMQAGAAIADWTAAGLADASMNGFTNGTNNTVVTFTDPPATGQYTTNAYAVQANVSQKVTSIFKASTITLNAWATVYMPPTPCVYLLSLVSTQPALYIDNETVTGSCPFYLGGPYLFYNSNSSSVGPQYFVTGASSASQGSVSPAPVFNAPVVPDPLSYVTQPTAGSCLKTSYTYTTNSALTLSPGTYCGNTKITSTAPLIFNPGVYVIAGSLTINGPTITGSGVTIFMTKTSKYTYGTCSISNANVTLSAPTTGTWQGILFLSDRAMPSLASGTAVLTVENWSPNSTLDGILYMVGQELNASNVTMQGVNYFGVVADDIGSPAGSGYSMHNSTFAPSADYSTLANGNPFHVSGPVGLVE